MMKVLCLIAPLVFVGSAIANKTAPGGNAMTHTSDNLLSPGLITLKAKTTMGEDFRGREESEKYVISMDVSLPSVPQKFNFEMHERDQMNNNHDKYVTKAEPKLVKVTDISLRLEPKKKYTVIIKVEFDLDSDQQDINHQDIEGSIKSGEHEQSLNSGIVYKKMFLQNARTENLVGIDSPYLLHYGSE